MRSCFPCGRSAARVLQLELSNSSSKESVYFNDLNKDFCTSLIKEVKTHLNMGSFDLADAKYMEFFLEEKSNTEAVVNHSCPLAKEEQSTAGRSPENALILQLDGHREKKLEEHVVSTNVSKNGNFCRAEKREDECNTFTSMSTPIEEVLCSQEEKKENLEGDFIEDKRLADTNELADMKRKLSTRAVVSVPAMVVETAVNKASQSLLIDRFADDKELLAKVNPEGVNNVMRNIACDADNHQNPKPDYAEVNLPKESKSAHSGKKISGAIHGAHEDYYEYYDKDAVTSSSKQLPPTAPLFSYGISDQQRDFLFLCAGLVIQAVGFQLRSLAEVATALILICYRAYIFACHFADTLSHAKQKLTETHSLLLSYVALDSTRFALHKEKWESMKPLIIKGAKKMGWGCLKAAYVAAVLAALLLTSFLFSYLAVKGGAIQKPLHIKQELFFDYTQAHPVASLDLFSLDAYSRMSNATKGSKVNSGAGVRYHGTVLLTLPESDHNRKLGVFQVRSEVLSEKGEIMVRGSQPCMLAFKSSALHYMKSMIMAIPVLTGLASETQTLKLQLLEWHHDLQESSSSSRGSARVLQIFLVPRAGLTSSTGLPQLYKAHLLLDSLHVIGPRSVPISPSSTFLRTFVLWIVLSFFIFGCLSTFYMYKMRRKS